MFFKKKLIYLSKSLFFIKFQRVICFGGDLSLILKIAHIMYLIDLGVPKIGFLFFFLGGIWRGCLAQTFICIQSVNFPCTHQLTRLFRSVTFPQRSDHETDRPSECLTVFLFLFLSSSRSPLDRPTDQPIGRLGGLASGSVYPTNWWWHHETFAPSVW